MRHNGANISKATRRRKSFPFLVVMLVWMRRTRKLGLEKVQALRARSLVGLDNLAINFVAQM